MLSARPSFICIIKTGSALPEIAGTQGDFEDWIHAGLLVGLPETEGALSIEVLDARSDDQTLVALPPVSQCAGIVVTGSHAMVTDAAPWMVALESWLRDASLGGVPVLGICFGHQMVAHALGGLVGPHLDGLELGSVRVAVRVDVSGDPLWQDMPAEFDANAVHYQTVIRLPADAVALAANLHEPHRAFRWRSNVWGVQFHLEFNRQVM